MAKLTWNDPGTRFFEDGVDRVVLYPMAAAGVAWSGVTSIDENVVGGEQTPLYFDGVKYLDILASEDFQAVLSAYASPAAFAACDGTRTLAPGLFATQQPRQPFNLSYRTKIGNDAKGLKAGYKIHMVYNVMASPASKSNKTLAETPAPETRSWTLDATPAPRGTLLIKPTAHLIIDTTKVRSVVVDSIESILYGSINGDPTFLEQATLVAIMNS